MVNADCVVDDFAVQDNFDPAQVCDSYSFVNTVQAELYRKPNCDLITVVILFINIKMQA